MAVVSKGVTTGLTVLNGIDGGVKLPVNAEAVIARQVALEEYIKKFVRTGGKGKLQRDGKIYYTILAKENLSREVTVTSDGSVVTGGMYGAESSEMFGYVKPSTVKAYEDFTELIGGKFLKELITKRELEQENLPTLATDRISTYQNGNSEKIINDIKLAIVAAVGTVGKAATDAKWSATEPRQIDKDYDIDEAGGVEIYNDIDAAVGTLLNIGRMGSPEEDYPFARGADGSQITLGLSRNANRALTIAFKESPAGTFPGMVIDAKKGDVLNLFGVEVEKMEAMPEKNGHAFNWVLVTKGENGAIAMPSVFSTEFLIRPHYEGISLLGQIIEGIGGSWGIKFFQPELVIGSFAATATAPANDEPSNDDSSEQIESFVLGEDDVVVSKKTLNETKKALQKAKDVEKELKALKEANAKAIKKAESIAAKVKKEAEAKVKKEAEDKAKEEAEANNEAENVSSN